MLAGCYGSLGEGRADSCPLCSQCTDMNLGWQVNELSVDITLLSLFQSLALFSLCRMLYQRQRTKNDSSKSMMSSSSFLRRITGLCRGTLPPFGRLRDYGFIFMMCIYISCVSVYVYKLRRGGRRGCWVRLHWIELIDCSQWTFTLVMNWFSNPL